VVKVILLTNTYLSLDDAIVNHDHYGVEVHRGGQLRGHGRGYQELSSS